jgi:S-adenosyl-L-methionine hydrolase (adenosine-forming)
MSKPDSIARTPICAEPISTAPFDPCGVVSLLTDFGLSDPYVGMMKAVILARCPTAKLVDITHGVPAQDVRVGAFYLSRSWRHFPRGTVHLAVVDPGVGTERKLLVAVEDGHAFVGPDNGLLAASLSANARVGELDVARFALAAGSHTFHGRDVMAPAVAALASGLAVASAVRAPVSSIVAAPFHAPRPLSAGGLEVEVLVADHYGNLILACGPDDLDGPLAGWCVEIAGREIAFARTYAQVDPGQLVALVDSFPALEIAVRDGSARDVLDLDRGDRVNLRKRPC